MFRTIKLIDIFQDGIPCTIKNLKVETLGNVLLPCQYTQTEFTIQLDETTESVNCITITIDCEDCNLCPPIIRQYCFCDNVLLKCPDCHECIGGRCVDKCNGKKCKNGQCVDCIVQGDCRGGKICTPDGCKCPSGSYEDSAGICRQCINNGHCKNCETCYGYTCTPKACPGQILNILTCACEECTGREHCGTNQYCDGGKCKCLPNYIWDPAASTCVPRPTCGPTVPCPDCYNCVNGECMLNPCPTGFVNSGIAGKCCVRECDCSTKVCAGQGTICVLYDINKCFCQTCEGNCDENTPCTGLGCTCDYKTKKCVPNPCDRPCDPSNPCPAGCGCLNGRCVGCSFLTCAVLNLCGQAVGCNCDGSNNCVTSDCKGTCFGNPFACLGLNCGCDQTTRTCVDCTKIPCGNGGICPFGCGCDQNTGYCKKDPCDKPCETGADCGYGCGCDPTTKRCRACSSYNCTSCLLVPGCDCINGSYCGPTPRPECEETLKVTRLGNCTLKGELQNPLGCCPCTDIALESILTWTGANELSIHFNLRKGLLATSPLLGDNSNANVADNELATYGTVAYTLAVSAYTVSCSSGFPTINIPPVIFDSYFAMAVVANLDAGDVVFSNVPKIGEIFNRDGKCYKAFEINVYASTVNNLLFQGRSECEAGMVKQLVSKSTSTTFANGLNIFDQLKGCANPLLKWYKGTTQALATLFRKAYAPNNIDIVTEADGLAICNYYKLTHPNCGCAKDVWYNCGGTNLYVGTKLIFCQPVDLIIQSLDSCNNSIKILETLVCPAMKTAVYKLWINGVQEGASFSPDVNNKLFTGNLTVSKAYPIVQVKLTVDCDDCEGCTITKNLTPSSDPCVCGTNDWVLSNSGSNCSNISILITGNTGAPAGTLFTFESQFGNGAGVIGGGGTAVVNIGGPHVSGSYVITVIINGCRKNITVALSGCCELNPGTYSYNCGTKVISQPIAPTGNGTGPYTYQIELGVWTNFTIGGVQPAALADGAYRIKVTDSITGCVDYALLLVACSNELTATAQESCSGVDPACPGITIEVLTGNGPFSVYTALIAGGPWTLRTNSLAVSTPYSYNDCGLTPGDLLYWKITDSSAIVQEITGSIVIVECVEWTAEVNVNCAPDGDGTIVVTFNDTGDYRVLIDPDPSDGVGSETQFPPTGWIHKTAGSSEPYAAVNQTYDVTVQKQGSGEKAYNNKIVNCDEYTILHDCTLGFRIERNGSPFDCYIKIDNNPGSPLLLSTLGVFFVPGGLHYLNIYDPGNPMLLLAQLSFSGINTCCPDLTTSVFCNGDGTGTLGFVWGAGHCGIGFHDVTIYDSLGAVVGTSGANNGSFILPNDTYSVEGVSTCTNDRYWQNGAILYCTTTKIVVVDCVDSCGLNTALIPVSNDISACGGGGSCTTIVTNNHGFAVNYVLESKPFAGDCSDLVAGVWTTITSGQIQPNGTCGGSCTVLIPTCAGGCVCNIFTGSCQGIFRYCTLGGSLCYRITITRPGNIDPACKIVKGFNCP